ncbi:hypothetical protein CY35_10G069300 [Sphagnum magellanicum]|nr:hypothetical protein CY35_10G069300 [Sphagnum magellanicum]KAH9550389.1 hypothetical protein CY35_10G069300 [Sphagnum magellanicum]KAH9550390.1 hypothetical protein CY35_10G069300 [Sphagnum magellanicum]KAH9550391.1 hypothetical protein CY35_10G069300 [Sphagnum magellanicum]KAH9550392.1 hypothetical protein CY35_10G069300 [Sphagnum magellanicum]
MKTPLLLYNLLGSSSLPWQLSDEDVDFGTPWCWIYVGISSALVLFASIMSSLTLGLMSLGLIDLEHQLLVTLLLCNAAAMEALPIFLDTMFNEVVAVILLVTFVLAFGEVIPQAVYSRHGLAVGANLVWLVKILMVLCFPISYPVGKILDYLLGHNDSALFRRAQLKALVSIHGKEVSSMKKTETVCKMEVMLWMSVAWKFWLSEICRSYVCQTFGMMATM